MAQVTSVFLVALLLLSFVVRSFLLEPFSTMSGSMLPTLQIGDHLLVSKYAYGYSRYSLPFDPPVIEGRIFGRLPERGDVAVYRKPGDEETDYIKRIVGLPGDRIRMIGGRLHINGEPVARERVGERIHERRGGGSERTTEYIETLPSGRSHRIWERGDSEFADNTPAYRVPEGHVFVMGDNRDNSLDSRALYDVGYVPVENLIGRLAFVFWNSEEGTQALGTGD